MFYIYKFNFITITISMANHSSSSHSPSPTLRNSSRSLLSILAALAIIFVMSILLRIRDFPPNFHRLLLGTIPPSKAKRVKRVLLSPKHKYMLRHNANLGTNISHICPKVLVLRTPKTASSSLAAIFFLRRVALGKRCAKLFFPSGMYLPRGQYTITDAHLNESVALKHSAFIAHMNYTPNLRGILHVNRLFRIATLRKPSSRAYSLLSYEEKRPHVRLRPALEYLGAPRFPPSKAKYDEIIAEKFKGKQVDIQVNAVLKHWNLILITEYWDMSLTVLMHTMKWRFVDILAPSLNIQDVARKNRALKRISAKRTTEEKKHLKWTTKIDAMLYKKAAKLLRRKFDKLPRQYRKIPAYLKLYRPLLTKRCGIHPHQKSLGPDDMRCIRAYRVDLLKAANVRPANA